MPVVPTAPSVVAEATVNVVCVAFTAALSVVKVSALLTATLVVEIWPPLELRRIQSMETKFSSGCRPFTSAQTMVMLPLNGPPGLPLVMLNFMASVVATVGWLFVRAKLLAGSPLYEKSNVTERGCEPEVPSDGVGGPPGRPEVPRSWNVHGAGGCWLI